MIIGHSSRLVTQYTTVQTKAIKLMFIIDMLVQNNLAIHCIVGKLEWRMWIAVTNTNILGHAQKANTGQDYRSE